MSKHRIRLIFSLSGVILVVLSVLGILIGQVFKEFYLEHLTDRMKKEANLISLTLESGEHDYSNHTIQDLVLNISDRLNARVTIIDADGSVIAESEENPLIMENHIDRPEIQAVLKGEEGKSIRYSDTINAELIYYAIPIIENGQISTFVRMAIPIQALNDVNRKIWGLVIISFTLAFLVIVMFSSRITNQMMRPIEEATRVAKQLTKGNYKVRTYEGKGDETGQLSRSINVLARNLDRISKTHQIQQERLETLIDNMGSGLLLINTKGDITLVNRSCKGIFLEDTDLWLNKLYYDVIKHKEINKIVQEIFLTESSNRKQIAVPIQYEIRHFDVNGAPIIGNKGQLKGIVLVFHEITELQKLEQMRKDFVANVSHELKTPVTSVRGFTETLLDGAMDDATLRKRFLTIILKESERLQGLISDLLELSKIEQQHFEINWQQVNMDAIADDVLVLLRDKAEKKEILLTKHAQGGTNVLGDPYRIKQIMINLITNSIMYTPSGGKINVKVIGMDEKVQFQVSDTGIGIGASELPRIFERFYRVDRARSRNSGGTGLGLAIVKHLVEAHHGKVEVDSEVGKGTTFMIDFYKEQQ